MVAPESVREPRSIEPAAALIETDIFPGKGRGVRARAEINEGSVIEQAPVILLRAEDLPLIERTVLSHYYFSWEGDPESGSGALALGLISLCNHAAAPNCRVVRDIDGQRLELVAQRLIQAGEELTIDYGSPVWFAVVP